MQQKLEDISLPVRLSDQDVQNMGTELANQFVELNRLKSERDQGVADLKEQYKEPIEQAEQAVATLSQALHKGEIVRQVECAKELDFGKGITTIYRRDTGEVIEQRPMTADERQSDLEDQEEES